MLIFMLFIIGVALGGLTVIFAMQNIEAVTVSFFSWHLEGSLSLILMLATLMGILIALLITLPEGIRGYFRYRALRRENARLEEELRKQKELTHFARKEPPTRMIIAAIAIKALFIWVVYQTHGCRRACLSRRGPAARPAYRFSALNASKLTSMKSVLMPA